MDGGGEFIPLSIPLMRVEHKNFQFEEPNENADFQIAAVQIGSKSVGILSEIHFRIRAIPLESVFTLAIFEW